ALRTTTVLKIRLPASADSGRFWGPLFWRSRCWTPRSLDAAIFGRLGLWVPRSLGASRLILAFESSAVEAETTAQRRDSGGETSLGQPPAAETTVERRDH